MQNPSMSVGTTGNFPGNFPIFIGSTEAIIIDKTGHLTYFEPFQFDLALLRTLAANFNMLRQNGADNVPKAQIPRNFSLKVEK